MQMLCIITSSINSRNKKFNAADSEFPWGGVPTSNGTLTHFMARLYETGPMAERVKMFLYHRSDSIQGTDYIAIQIHGFRKYQLKI